MPLNSTDLFVVQRGNSIYKVTADQVAPSKKITTVDVETINTRPENYGLPFSTDFPGSTQQDVNWYLYDRTLETSNVSVGPNPPSTTVNGDLWWSTLEGNLFIWYEDDDSSQWVDASPAFVEIDYQRIEDYLDQAVLDNAVSQIIPSGIVTVDPPAGTGVVTVGVDTTDIDADINALKDDVALRVTITDFETDQQRQDDEIDRLENIIQDLADRLTQIEDELSGATVIDGGFNNAAGIFDEPATDGGTADPASLTGTDIDGGNAEGYD